MKDMKKIIMKRFGLLKNELESEKGMTLIELLIVITILAIIGAFVAPRLMDLPKKARTTSAKKQIQSFELSLQRYEMEKGNPPSSEEGLQALVTEGYIRRIPKDPWKNEYQYRYPGENDQNSYEIWSFGADGKAGGESYNADIKSWE